MKRLILAASLTLVAAVPAAARPPSPSHARQYQRAYSTVRQKLGRRAPGRNIVRWGFDARYAATDAEVVVSLGVLERMLAAPPVPVAITAQPTSSFASVAGTGLPACASESGTNYSTGPANTNPSGATGRYQIMPFHWSTDCAGLSPTPSGQDRCAAIIYRNSGAGAWVGCGG